MADLRSLASMELDRCQGEILPDPPDAGRIVVGEYPDSGHEGRQPPEDLPGHGDRKCPGSAWNENEADRVGSQIGRRFQVFPSGHPAEFDVHPHVDHSRNRERGSSSAIRRSPTRKAWYPTSESRSRSRRWVMPLSLTRTHPGGNRGASSRETRSEEHT